MIDLTRKQLSLLLYFETCLVDHCGRVDSARINDEERALAKSWAKGGLIGFGRIAARDCTIGGGSLWVTFSDEAWRLAHDERRARADRTVRNYETTAEKQRRGAGEQGGE